MSIHANCLVLKGLGLLIFGASGSGKSSLSLRLMEEQGAELVADDQVELVQVGGHLIASAPEDLRGLMEIRGLGIIKQPAVARTRVHLLVELAPFKEIERMPEKTKLLRQIEGVELPLVKVDGHLPAALAVVLAAVKHFNLA